MRYLLLALALLFPATLHAGNFSINYGPADLGLAGVALNTSPVMTLRSDGYAMLTVYLAYTRSTATAVNMTCTSGPTLTVQAPLGVAAIAGSGAISMTTASWSYPVTASGTLRMIVAPINDIFIKCTFTGTSASGGDVISAYARLGGTP